MKYIKEFIQDLDSLGAQIKLTYKRQQNQKTLIGALLTILAYIIIIFCAYRLIFNYLDKTNVDVTVSSQVSRTYHEIDLSKAHFYPIFIPLDSNKDPIEHEDIDRFFNFAGYTFNFTLNFTGGVDRSSVKVTNSFGFIPCSDTNSEYYKVFYDPENDFVKTLVEETGLCPDVSDFSLFRTQGGLSEQDSSFIKIFVFPCQEGVTDDCASLEQLNGASLITMIPKFSFDPENLTNPVTMKANLEDIATILPGVNYKRNYKLIKTEIWDDRSENIFAQPFLKDEFFSVDSEYTKTDFTALVGDREDFITCTGEPDETCVAYFEFLIKSGLKTTVIKRKYTKAADVLGEIGGIQQLVLLGFGVIWLAQERCARREMARDAIGDLVEGQQLYDSGGGSLGPGGDKNQQSVPINKILPKSSSSLIKTHKYHQGSAKEVRERVRIMEKILQEGLDCTVLLRRINDLTLASETFLPPVLTKMIPFLMVNRHLNDSNNKNSLHPTKKEEMNQIMIIQQPPNFKFNFTPYGGGGTSPGEVELIQLPRPQNPSIMLKYMMLDYLENDSSFDSFIFSQIGNEEIAMDFEPTAPLNEVEMIEPREESEAKADTEDQLVPGDITAASKTIGLEKSNLGMKKAGLMMKGQGNLTKSSDLAEPSVASRLKVDHKDSTQDSEVPLSNQESKTRKKKFEGIAQKPRKLSMRQSIRKLSLKK